MYTWAFVLLHRNLNPLLKGLKRENIDANGQSHSASGRKRLSYVVTRVNIPFSDLKTVSFLMEHFNSCCRILILVMFVVLGDGHIFVLNHLIPKYMGLNDADAVRSSLF